VRQVGYLQRSRRGVEVHHFSFFNLGARWRRWLTPRPGHFNSGKDPVPTVQVVGSALRSMWTGRQNPAPTGMRSPDIPGCSESLYWLSYPLCPDTLVSRQMLVTSETRILQLTSPGTSEWHWPWQTITIRFYTKGEPAVLGWLYITALHMKYHSPTSSAEFENERSYTSTPPFARMCPVWENFTLLTATNKVHEWTIINRFNRKR